MLTKAGPVGEFAAGLRPDLGGVRRFDQALRYAVLVSDDRGFSPVQRELARRWTSYLASGRPEPDTLDWVSTAFAQYEDEVVHGLQRFKGTLKTAPTEKEIETSRLAYALWNAESERFADDPAGWENEYWVRYIERLRAFRPRLADRVVEQMREQSREVQ